jgi:spermidine synthase
LLVLACFFLSGFAALLYETAWTREFAFLFGTSEIAMAAVLGAYMAGLALGAAIAGRITPRVTRPILVYAVLELVIALAALGMPFGLDAVNWIYASAFGGAPAPPPEGAAVATAFQLASAFLLLMIPTSCMGATLPLLARQSVDRDSQIGPRIGALYAINTAGAIGGVLVAGFLLLPEIGLRKTVWVGVAVNVLVFVVAAFIGRTPGGLAPEPIRRRVGFSWVLPVIALSGAASFVYEVLWIRLLVHQLGGSVYAFATMLGSFLTGIALGGAIAAPIARRRERAAVGFLVAEVAVGVLGLVTFLAADRLPDLAAVLGVSGPQDLARSALVAAAVLVPLATAVGATFPFAVRIAARDAADAAAASARVTAWNTLGSILGSLGAALFFLPGLGFAGTVQLAAGTNFALAAVAAVATGRRVFAVVCAATLAACLIFAPPVPWKLVKKSALSGRDGSRNTVYFAVGRGATVRLERVKGGYQLFTNGLPESHIESRTQPPQSHRLTDVMGLVTTLLRPGAERLLVVGMGGGSVLGASPPSIRGIDVSEIEEEVVEANRQASEVRRNDPLEDPRLHTFINDARGALILSETKYDGIVAQASHPWTAGAAHLYTREFFELVRERLVPGGVFSQWMGLPFVDEPLLRTLVATMSSVFPYVVVFHPDAGGLIFAGSDGPLSLLPGVRRGFDEQPEALERFGLYAVEDLAAMLLLDEEGAVAFGAGAPLNTDDHNLLAARSSRLSRGQSMNIRRLVNIVGGNDALIGISAELRPQRLVRVLAGGRKLRAERIAETLSDGDREVALGWIAFADGKHTVAREHFLAGLEAGGEPHEAQSGLALVTRDRVPDELEGSARLPAEARILGFEYDWEGVAQIDDELARIPRGDPLFVEANRLRARWRMVSGRKEEAVPILDAILVGGGPRRSIASIRRLRSQAVSGAAAEKSPDPES